MKKIKVISILLIFLLCTLINIFIYDRQMCDIKLYKDIKTYSFRGESSNIELYKKFPSANYYGRRISDYFPAQIPQRVSSPSVNEKSYVPINDYFCVTYPMGSTKKIEFDGRIYEIERYENVLLTKRIFENPFYSPEHTSVFYGTLCGYEDKSINYVLLGREEELLYIQFERDDSIPELADPAEETRKYAMNYFEKHVGKEIAGAIDENAEYKLVGEFDNLTALTGASPSEDWTEFYEDYIAATKYYRLYYSPFNHDSDVYAYRFQKFINEKPTLEYVDVFVFSNGQLYGIANRYSAPLTSDDDIDYVDEEVHASITSYISDYYSGHFFDVSDIEIEYPMLYKDTLGRRAVSHCVTVTLSYGLYEYKTIFRTMTRLENAELIIRYPHSTAAAVEAVLIVASTLSIIVICKKSKKQPSE